jgi:hypothetical protein
MAGQGITRPGDTIAVLTLPYTFHTDTIGGLISVPIIIKGLDKPRDVEMTLDFDKGLIYNNTSLGAKRFDVAGTLTETSVKILISAADINLGSVSAYANFTIYPDPLSSWNVRFDSLSVPSLGVQCQDMTNSFSATLTGPAGCGIGTLTRYVRTGRIELGSIIPNPTRGGIDVSFALPADDNITFELVDSRGIILRSLSSAMITKGSHTLHFDLTNEAAGNYFVKMTTASGEEISQKFIISK